ncbi:hypothetical protein Afil01_69000 [Actinorhabdospora filicis]|uniref:DoxX family protein n=1 Tax=Actinorhabdospora filicis TaxID=1785913 RepID=A0A9W6SU44_9ACTN|nr:DoxX family protein [Actinorhabdospora filicis]GLZ82093.1 hypothetical protein Afil01_69000 [Actinorhabdospora filicis]
MAPLIALLGGTAVFRVLGFLGVDYFDWTHSVRGGLSLMFIVTGVVHFVPLYRRGMIAMIPPKLPAPGFLVTFTGVAEIAGAIGLWVPPTARAAAICLGLLLLAMFPANMNAARNGIELAGKKPTPIPRRAAEQVLYLAAAVIAAL